MENDNEIRGMFGKDLELLGERFQESYYDEFLRDYEGLPEGIVRTPSEYRELSSFSDRARASVSLLAWREQQYPEQPDYVVRETNQELGEWLHDVQPGTKPKFQARIETDSKERPHIKYYLNRATIGAGSSQQLLGYVSPIPHQGQEFSITTEAWTPTTHPLPFGYRNSNFVTHLMDTVSIELISVEIASVYNRVSEEYEKQYGRGLK